MDAERDSEYLCNSIRASEIRSALAEITPWDAIDLNGTDEPGMRDKY